MGRNVEKDSIEMAARNQRILEKGLMLFAEKGIEKVTMSEVARAAGVGVASLYRYYSTKPELVLAIGTWGWKRYVEELTGRQYFTKLAERNGAEGVAFYLDAYLDLYRNHKALLRFNQFFNVYLQSAPMPADELAAYNAMVGALEQRFARIYSKGQEDGTLRGDVPEGEMFSTLTHLMLAAVTRYAVGLVYDNGESNPEKELETLRSCLIGRFCTGQTSKAEEAEA